MPKRTVTSDLAANSQPVLTEARYSRLLHDVQRLIANTRAVADQQRVAAHWNLGRRIARERVHERAGYHNSILRDLSAATGMATRTLQYAVRLHRIYPTCPNTTLTLRHYQVLVDCPNAEQRAHYEALALADALDSRSLRQRIVQDQRLRNGTSTLLPRPTDAGYLYKVKVDQIVDGDTYDLSIDLGFHTDRRGRFRLAAVDCPELPTPEGRRARDFVYKRLLNAKTILVKTQRTDLHGRYVTHLFYSAEDLDITTCFTHGTHLNEELLREGHAVLAV